MVNVYTKFPGINLNNSDLCSASGILPKVKSLYDKHRDRCNQYLMNLPEFNPSDRKYYVYAWYAKTSPKRYFYVGKGTGKRYKHILGEIDKSHVSNNIRWERYAMIQDKWGIDAEILLDHLSEYEALIYELCLKLEFLRIGEVLLNVEGIPAGNLPEGWYEPDRQIGITPLIVKDPFYQKFMDDYREPYFDSVNVECLSRVYFYPYFLDPKDENVINDKNSIIEWLNEHNAKVYKTISTGTKSVIIQGNLMYDTYLRIRNQGKVIYSSKDVLDRILWADAIELRRNSEKNAL